VSRRASGTLLSAPAEEDDHGRERWLVSYADFITLLFAFFVVMFATSRSDQNKLRAMSDAIARALNDGVFTPSSANIPLSDPGSSQMRAVGVGEAPADVEVERELEAALEDPEVQGHVTLRRERRGIVISLTSAGYYAAGKVEPDRATIPVIDALTRVALHRELPVRVEGHTDFAPAERGRSGNLTLSSARAGWVAQRMIEIFEFPPEKVSIAGYGHYRPVASNATPEGRAANRRVDLVLLTHPEATALEAPPGTIDEVPLTASGLVRALEREVAPPPAVVPVDGAEGAPEPVVVP
jgi:chemotaxis protein MotB